MRVSANLVVGTVAVIATGAILYMVFRKGGTLQNAAGAVVNAINPASPTNVVSLAANAITQTVTGDPSTSFGSFIYDLLNPDDMSGKIAIAPSTPRAAGAIIDINEYWANVERDDMEAGEQARIAIAFDDGAFSSNEGGAPFGNPLIMRQGVRYGATR